MNLSQFSTLAFAFGAAFLAALWFSLIVWTYRDVRNRVRDSLVHVLAVLLVAILNLPGVLIYLVLRPPHTLEEEYQHLLEEEALLTAIEEQPLCPGCERRVKEDWQYCPNCHTRLKKACTHCGRLMDLSWQLCPYCGTPTPGLRREDVRVDEIIDDLSAAAEGLDDSEPTES